MKYYNIGSGLAYQIYLVFQHIEKEHIYNFLSHHLPHSQSLRSNLAFPELGRFYIQDFPGALKFSLSRVCYWVSSLLKLIPFINSCLHRSFTYYQSRLIAHSTILQQTLKSYLQVPRVCHFTTAPY